MTFDFQTTSLWRTTLAEQENDEFDAERSALRAAYLQFRSVVATLAGEIAISMPMFTDHSIAHIDSLWDVASEVLGEDQVLNPAEAFVLGGAFLLHDLGMGLAAYPDGKEGVEKDPLYKDVLASILQRDSPNTDATKPEDRKEAAALEALVTVLRLRHARQAETLVSTQFTTSGNQPFFLLESAELRAVFGPLIGKIARSHWQTHDDLAASFSQKYGSHPQHPSSWDIDPLKLACILRIADACHIDSRRAPTYLHAFRRPSGISGEHWYFQERLLRPRVEGDRLVYASTASFGPEESAAWWLCFETIGMIDGELRAVDALCADLGRPRFGVRSVAGAESPDRFAGMVAAQGWQPVDAQLKVTEVDKVVSSLGGSALYGDAPFVSVRELIANAADSTRARYFQFGGSDTSITVKVTNEEDQWWLEVHDSGLGMSAEKMVSALTDFGHSGWTSSDVFEDYPGLIAKGYKPIGRFGIGFFSVFMLADFVEVSSLQSRRGADEASILRFTDGTRSRPILLKGNLGDRQPVHGTTVRMLLREPPLSRKGLFGTNIAYGSIGEMLKTQLRTVAALIEFDLFVQTPDDDEPVLLVGGDSWKNIAPGELFDRVFPTHIRGSRDHRKSRKRARELFELHMRDVLDETGDVCGRVMLAAPIAGSPAIEDSWVGAGCLIYVGGLAATSVPGLFGVMRGEPTTASRMSAYPVAPLESLRPWAEEQARLILSISGIPIEERLEAAALVRSLGGNDFSLPIALTTGGLMNRTQVEEWLQGRDRVTLIPDYEIMIFDRQEFGVALVEVETGLSITPPEDALIISMSKLWPFPESVEMRPLDTRFAFSSDVPDPVQRARAWWHYQGPTSSATLVLDAVARSWDVDPVALAVSAEDLDVFEDSDSRLVVASVEGAELLLPAIRLSRP